VVPIGGMVSQLESHTGQDKMGAARWETKYLFASAEKLFEKGVC